MRSKRLYLWDDSWSTNVPVFSGSLDYRGSSSSSGHGQAMRNPCDTEGNLTDGTSLPPMQGGFAAILSGSLAHPSNATTAASISRLGFGVYRHYWASTSRNIDFLNGYFLAKDNVKIGVGSHVKFFMDGVRCKQN